MAVSQNSWPVDPPRSSRLVPGTSVKLNVANGPAGDILLWVAGQFHHRVENIEGPVMDDWGYANRPVRGSTSTSNHASATAIDLNSPKHPLGVRGTFNATQAATIRQILREAGGVVRWGGDYSGRVDEMHFEINANAAAVSAAYSRLQGSRANPTPAPAPTPSGDDDMQISELYDWRDGKGRNEGDFRNWFYGQWEAMVGQVLLVSKDVAEMKARPAAPAPAAGAPVALDYALLAKAMCDEQDRRARDGDAKTGPAS